MHHLDFWGSFLEDWWFPLKLLFVLLFFKKMKLSVCLDTRFPSTFAFWVFFFFFFFFFHAFWQNAVTVQWIVTANVDFLPQTVHYVLFMDPQISLFSNFFIKNGSHGTIYTFKNYFATVISAISFQFQQNKSYPNRP